MALEQNNLLRWNDGSSYAEIQMFLQPSVDHQRNKCGIEGLFSCSWLLERWGKMYPVKIGVAGVVASAAVDVYDYSMQEGGAHMDPVRQGEVFVTAVVGIFRR